MPTVTPLPSSAKLVRAFAAFELMSPSETAAPLGQPAALAIGASTSVTPPTLATAPIAARSAGRAATVTAW